jgi:hypothetical protein
MSWKKFDSWNPWIIALLFFVLVLSLKSPILNTPHFWDSLNRVHNAQGIESQSLNPFLEEGEDILKAQGRPPFFLELLALTWTVFGNSLFISHLVVVFFSFLGVFFSYLLGRLLFDPKIGLLSAIFLFFSPLYYAQSGILNFAVPLTAFSVMTIYFALKENRTAYFITACCLVLTKETGMLILITIVVVIIIRCLQDKETILKAFFYASPILVYLLWLIACKIHYGWFLFPSHTDILNVSSISLLIKTTLNRITQLCIKNYHWLMTFIIIISSRKWLKNLSQEIDKVVILLGGIAVYVAFFSFYSVELERYLLPIYPLLFLLFSRSIDLLTKGNWRLQGISLLIVASLFISNWGGNRSVFGYKLETNLEYLDFIQVHQKASHYIESNFPDKHVLTDWPQTMELRHPFEGYVSKPIQTSSIFEDYDLSEIDLIYFVPQSVKKFIDLVDQLDLELLVRFEKKGKVVEIYKLLGT